MKITIEFETVEELASLIDLRDQERDALRDRKTELEMEPLKYSLSGLAQKVTKEMGSLTPGQKDEITKLIESVFQQ